MQQSCVYGLPHYTVISSYFWLVVKSSASHTYVFYTQFNNSSIMAVMPDGLHSSCKLTPCYSYPISYANPEPSPPYDPSCWAWFMMRAVPLLLLALRKRGRARLRIYLRYSAADRRTCLAGEHHSRSGIHERRRTLWDPSTSWHHYLISVYTLHSLQVCLQLPITLRLTAALRCLYLFMRPKLLIY